MEIGEYLNSDRITSDLMLATMVIGLLTLGMALMELMGQAGSLRAAIDLLQAGHAHPETARLMLQGLAFSTFSFFVPRLVSGLRNQ